jgi:3-hydroxybutyryl-CoA dehydrogenase
VNDPGEEFVTSVKRVGIVGSGIMGSGIAEVAGRAGFEVVLRSRTERGADSMVAGLEKSLNRQVEKGKLEETERAAVLDRVSAVTDLGDLSECDLVLESVVEDLAIKKHLFSELDRICPDGTILATNTSTLPIVEMAMETGRPHRVCGIHFFNPAPAMPLVEIVRAVTTSDETVTAARAFAEACGKSPVEVRDQAGFIVNALLPCWARHQPGDPRGAVRRVPRPELRSGATPQAHGGCGTPRPQGPPGLL